MFTFKFADIGEGIHEGKVFELLVKEGDSVKEGQNLLSVETDKITAELPSPVTGKVTKFLVKPGEVIHVGQDMVSIDDGSSTPVVETKPEPKPTETKTEKVSEGGASVVGEVKVSNDLLPSFFTGSSTTSTNAASSSKGSVGTQVSERSNVLATPLARAMAADLKVDMNAITGTGPNARVTKQDVIDASSRVKSTSTTPVSSSKPASGPGAYTPAQVKEPTQAEFFGDATEKRVAPSGVLNEVDVTRLISIREEVKADFEAKGIKITYLPYIVKAFATALEQHHEINAYYDDMTKELVYKREINIGIAVDSPNGLFVPVIKNANFLSVVEIARVELLLKSRKVKIVYGEAKFLTPKSISVNGDTISGTNLVVATGSEPIRLKLPGFDEGYSSNHLIDSTGALNLDKIPKKLIVVGGGVIGLEFAFLYAQLGSQVTIVQGLDRILEKLDNEVSAEATRMLKEKGIEIILNAKVIGFDSKTNSLLYEVENKANALKVEVALMAIGRKPISAAAVSVGIKADQRGFIQVNDQLETNIDKVYAMGDCVAPLMLAHVAYKHASMVANLLAYQQKSKINYDAVPNCIYTYPEIASIGKTEEELKASGTAYLKSKVAMKILGKAIADGDDKIGFIKLLYGPKYGELLGVHLIGSTASDIISEFATLLETEASFQPIKISSDLANDEALSGHDARAFGGNPIQTLFFPKNGSKPVSPKKFFESQRNLAAIDELGYVTPTSIQLQTILPLISGSDLMGLAQTGTGKTAAFTLPTLHRILLKPETKGIRALILAPTRELAEQIKEAIKAMAKFTNLKSISVYGGANISTQVKKLKERVDILVACPGRLLDHIRQRTVDLSRIETLVLDEADQMFDMGFLPDVKKIIKALPQSRQTLMFSATMPDDIRKLAHEILKNPITVQAIPTGLTSTIAHSLYPITHSLKELLLFRLLKDTATESVIIFTKMKHSARQLSKDLENQGYKSVSLQGNLSQGKRKAAMEGFKKGVYQIMVATDIAARGIDVSQISHVINYDMPDTPEAYTHRIGRTGRAGKSGDAFTFVTPADE
ncbi:unnamed protein product [Didymodactylos carnosus]|uniref:Dihydrolipoyl dehydrogenase n=1 Tax=Didymodactylos carnosus TaxID=1234261 RepID=A0A8S2GCK7_9BILA|nr:unnamed protein product [Didymodactylos carnosus]CAF3491602.1 unnamed protein product [Didymodactylos carnosus]